MVARLGHFALAPDPGRREQQGRRATIKAHSTHPLPTRPYGSLGLLPVSMASPSLNFMRMGHSKLAPTLVWLHLFHTPRAIRDGYKFSSHALYQNKTTIPKGDDGTACGFAKKPYAG